MNDPEPSHRYLLVVHRKNHSVRTELRNADIQCDRERD